MSIGRIYDIQSDGAWYVIQWAWLTPKDRPNAPSWWGGGYSKHVKLFPADQSWRCKLASLCDLAGTSLRASAQRNWKRKCETNSGA